MRADRYRKIQLFLPLSPHLSGSTGAGPRGGSQVHPPKQNGGERRYQLRRLPMSVMQSCPDGIRLPSFRFSVVNLLMASLHRPLSRTIGRFATSRRALVLRP